MNLYKKTATTVIPAMLSFALSGVYAIADGYFLGNAIGDASLAAINIAYPLTALLQALGSGIGMGGAVGYTLGRSAGDEKKAESYFTLTIMMLFIASVILIPLYLLFSTKILMLFGAEGEILSMCQDYIFVITLGAFLQIFSTGLVPLVRNMDGVTLSAVSMVVGFIFNVTLDGLFVWVFNWGIPGAAVATLAGQFASLIILVYGILRKKPVFSLKSLVNCSSKVKAVLKTGSSPFGLVFSPNIVIILLNKFLFLTGGSYAVTCYSIISYITWIILLLVQGVGDGSQPLFSHFYGRGEEEKALKVRRIAILYSFIITAISCALLYLLRFAIPRAFGSSPEVVLGVADVMPLFIFGLLFAPITRVVTAYYYATEKNLLSYLLVYGEVLLLALYLFLLSYAFSLDGVWFSVPLSQASISFVSIALVIMERRRIH